MTKEKITRKEAIKKMGKYAAFTALSTIILLSPKQAQAHSVCGGGHGNHGTGPHGGNGNGGRGGFFRRKK